MARFTVDETELAKAWISHSDHRLSVPGQVPRMSIPSTLTRKPPPRDLADRLTFTDPVLTASGVTRGLGLDPSEDLEIQTAATAALSFPALDFRTSLFQKLTHMGLDPAVQRAVMQRASSYYQERGHDQNNARRLTIRQDLTKSGRGGAYHRRVPKEGGGYRYFYAPEDYEKFEGAHVAGGDVLRKRCGEKLEKRVGDKGCALKDLAGFGGYPEDVVKDSIRDGVKAGRLVHSNGTLRLASKKAEDQK